MRRLALTAALVLAAFLAAGALGPAATATAPAPAPATGWTRLVGPAQPTAAVLTPAEAMGLPPTIQDGLGPGSALQMGVGGIQSVCTASFLLRDPATARYYLSTAGHCLVRDPEDATPVTGATHPDKTLDRIDICVAGCLNNGLGLGTYVSLRASDGFHPVAYAVSGGVGKDFGLIALPADLHTHLRPAMPQWGGPTGVAQSGIQLGALVAHYGHGTLLVPGVAAFVTRTPADQGRLASVSSTDTDAFEAVGHVTGGDSGSGASLAEPAGADLARGTQALGVITHSIVYAGAPLLSGTRLTHGLGLALQHTGLALELVVEGDPLPTTPDPAKAHAHHVNVSAPTDGATLDLASKRVHIRGTAQASQGLPGDSAVQVAVDDPDFGMDSRIPVSGNATWTAVWDLAGASAGKHTLRVRLVDAGGAVLDQENLTVTLAKGGSAAPGSSTPAPQPGGGAATPRGSASATFTPAGDGSSAPKATPGIPALAGLAVLALAAAVRRRR